MHLRDLEPESQSASPFAGVDARLKIVCATVLIVATLALPRYEPWWLAGMVVVLLTLSLSSRVPWRYMAIRLGIALPVLVAIAASLPFLHGGETVVFTVPKLGWAATAEGLFASGSAVGKSLICIWIAALLMGTTDFTHLLDGLSQLRAPSLAVVLMALIYRYVFVIGHETTRMLRARQSRGRPAGRLHALRVAVAMVGAMLLRCLDRSERIAYAMVARGFDGTIPSMHHDHSPNRKQFAGAATLCLGAITIVAASHLL